MTSKEIAAMKSRISVYVARITASLVERVTKDTAGDCWYCSMCVQPDNIPMGDYYDSHDHLIQHMQERYYPGTLIYNAWVEKWGSEAPSTIQAVRVALREYLEKRLGVRV